jgi:mRNA-degrading endonuclease RelE of RelBE toxin-antitoxin system
MAYRIEVSPEAEKRLKKLEKAVQERVRKKLDEIQQRLIEWGMEPDDAVEKRLRSPFNHILQQRVGDYRIWCEDIQEDAVLFVSFIGHKEDAKDALS